jgi:cysteine synthase A
MRGAIAKAQEISKIERAFMPSQFENPANPDIHQKTTDLEIWNQTQGNFVAFIAGVGTGGSISGCGKVFKTKNAAIKVFAVEPSESAVISGAKPGPHKIQGIGAGFVPRNLDKNILDGTVSVSSEEALAMAKKIIKEEGIPAGISTGANVQGALKLAAQNPAWNGKNVVVILPSYTERYLSTLLAEEARTKAQQLTAQAVDDEILAKVPLGSGIY